MKKLYVFRALDFKILGRKFLQGFLSGRVFPSYARSLSGVMFYFFLLSRLVAQPLAFTSTGIGGGGGLFSPSINPANGEEYYTVCDLGALYHTTDGGYQYEMVHFAEVAGDIFTKVCFTQDEDVRYTLKWDEANYAVRPAKSMDGGQTWAYLPGDAQPWEDRYFIYADYGNPDRVIWSTYSEIWITTDGGESEHWLYTAETNAGVLLSGVYFSGDSIYLGTNDGVLISTDGGQTVSSAGFSGIPSDERIMGFGAGSADGFTRFFALTGGAGDVWAGNLGDSYWGAIRGVYAMENMSGSWVPAMSGIDLNKDWAVFLGMALNDPDVCYLAGATDDPYEKPLVMKTEDGGQSWQHVFLTENNQNIYTGYQGYQGDFDYWWGGFAEGFAVNPLNADEALLTDLGFIHRTTDGGLSWHQRYVHPDDENLAGMPTPKKRYYRGVGLQQTSVWQVHWFDAENLFGCFTDIRGVRSVDGGVYWSMDYTGHELNTMYRIVGHNSEDLWFAATSAVHDMYETTYTSDSRVSPSWKAGKVLYTTDKGASWETMYDFGSPVVWVATHPGNDEVLYAAVVSPDGDGGVWRATGISNPQTATWEQLPSPQGANLGRPHNIRVLDDGTLVTSWAVRSNEDASVFFDGSGVFVSMDGGQSWENRSHPDMKYWTQDIVIDPFDESQNTWYACVWSGWGGPANDLGRLWRSNDRGVSWEPMTAPQQFHRVYSVSVDPNDAETMYLTTETEGLWVTHDKSAANPDWTLVAPYPYQAPRRVYFNPFNEGEMWVSSFGGGLMYGVTEGVGVLEKKGATVVMSPNPTVSEVELSGGFSDAQVCLYNSLGQQVRSYTHRTAPCVLDVSSLPPGIYGVVLRDEKGHYLWSDKLVLY